MGGRRLDTTQLRALETSLRTVLVEVFPREAWESALLPVFTENLSLPELEEVLAFQRTPLGRKLLAIQAQVATGAGHIGQSLMASRQAEFTRDWTKS